jgi:two-component system, sensor histidine kinase
MRIGMSDSRADCTVTDLSGPHSGRRMVGHALFDFLKFTFSAPARFERNAAEEQFLQDYAKRFLAQRRAISILAVVYWSAFSVWDIAQALGSEQFRRILPDVLALRFLGIVGLAGCAWLTFRKSFVDERYATRVLMTMVGIAYLLLGLMLLVVPFPTNYMYYSPGLFMVMIFAYGMFRLRARPGIRLTFAFILFSQFVYAFMANSPLAGSQRLFSFYYFLFSSLYLTSFAVIGCAIVVELERTARDAYARERQLTVSNQAITTKSAQLEQLNAALEESKRDTEVKTTALVAMKEEARIAAERSNLNKSKFLADAAHDLRQPMQALSNLLEAAQHALVRRDHDSSGKLLAGAQTALRSARSSFNAILDISRLESGFVHAEYSSFQIEELVGEVIAPLSVAANERGVALRAHFGTTNTIVRSDRHLLARVLTNIIGNAIKYSDPSKPKPAVVVGIVRLPNRARIDIIDNGIGIPPQHWEDVFQPFFQLGNPERDRERGLGLGLSIVKSVMQLLKEHRIDMRSTEGRGTRFSLDIPRTDQKWEWATKEPQQSAILEDVSGLYVIYVEDDALVRASMEALFEEYHILYEAVGSMQELKETLLRMERLPDLVITDYRLPDGWTAMNIVEVVFAHFEAEVPVVIVTAEVTASPAGIPRARLLSKPVAPEALLSAIASSCQMQPALA